MVVTLIALLLLACGNGEGPGSVTQTWGEYAGLDEGAAWSWRETADVLDSGGADITEAIRGRHTGDGYVEMRLGDPWADAIDLGFLQWDIADGIVLSGWRLGGAESGTPRAFVRTGTEPGEAVSENGFGCLTSRPSEPRTVYYATFEDVVEFDCQGDPALEGLWVFARGHGLIYVSAGIADWELIAPL